MFDTIHRALEKIGDVEITPILIIHLTVRAVVNYKFMAMSLFISLVLVTPRVRVGKAKLEDCTSEPLCTKRHPGRLRLPKSGFATYCSLEQ